jgi:hypothetical protein
MSNIIKELILNIENIELKTNTELKISDKQTINTPTKTDIELKGGNDTINTSSKVNTELKKADDQLIFNFQNTDTELKNSNNNLLLDVETSLKTQN